MTSAKERAWALRKLRAETDRAQESYLRGAGWVVSRVLRCHGRLWIGPDGTRLLQAGAVALQADADAKLTGERVA